MRIKFNRAVLLDSPNFIGLSCPNSVNKTSHFAGVVSLLLTFYRRVFHNISFWEKVPSGSHDDVRTWLSHDKNWLQGLPLFVVA